MKLRRAKTGKNPTPIPADKARADLLETIKTVLILCERMIEHLEGHQTVVEVSNYKADRWVDRLINGIKDGK